MRFFLFLFIQLSIFRRKFHNLVMDDESIDVFLLQPTRGRITVAGEDVRTFDKSEWARVVSIVNQVSSWISTHLL